MKTFKSSAILVAAAIAFLGIGTGCASVGANDALASRVSKLIDETTKSGRRQDKALRELEALGYQGVPYLVGHLGDTRSLAKPELSLENKAPDAFEGLRHYSPVTVHDALASILNQVTGEHFVFVYNGATLQEREENRRRWVDWCRAKFPTQVMGCSGEASSKVRLNK